MKLILMRHGTCEGLTEDIINGWLDMQLTSYGINDAKTAAESLKDLLIPRITKAYSSYLSRAYNTACIVLESLNNILPVTQDIRLNERHYGMFQGMVRCKAYEYPEYNTLSVSADRLDGSLIPISDEKYIEQVEEYVKKTGLPKWKLKEILPKSESILDVEKRVIDFLEKVIFVPSNANECILIVGHANTVKLITKYIEGLSYDKTTKLRFAPCGMKVYDLDYVESIEDEKNVFRYVLKNVVNVNREM